MKTPIFLILLFVVLPYCEFWLLFKIATRISFPATCGLVIFTGILGGWLARQQGWQAISRIQNDLSSAKVPTQSLMDGGMILVAAALLVTPGVMTDLFGFSLLFPPCRAVYRHWLAYWMKGKFKVQTFGTPGSTGGPFGPRRNDDEIEIQVVKPEDSERAD